MVRAEAVVQVDVAEIPGIPYLYTVQHMPRARLYGCERYVLDSDAVLVAEVVKQHGVLYTGTVFFDHHLIHVAAADDAVVVVADIPVYLPYLFPVRHLARNAALLFRLNICLLDCFCLPV